MPSSCPPLNTNLKTAPSRPQKPTCCLFFPFYSYPGTQPTQRSRMLRGRGIGVSGGGNSQSRPQHIP